MQAHGGAPLSAGRGLQRPRQAGALLRAGWVGGWRRYTLPMALALAAACWLAALLLAVKQPWLGLALEPPPAGAGGDVGLFVRAVSGPAAEAGIQPGSLLMAMGEPGQPAKVLQPIDGVAEPGALTPYEARDRFFQRQGEWATLLAERRPLALTLTPPGGGPAQVLTVTPQADRPLHALPVLFWLLLSLSAAVALIAGSAVSVHRSAWATGCLALAGWSLLMMMAAVAVYSTRELALPQSWFEALLHVKRAGVVLAGTGAVGLFLLYPRPLASPAWVVGILAFCTGWMLACWQRWLPAPGDACLGLGVSCFAMALLLGWQQIRRTREAALERAAALWLMVSLVAGAGLMLVFMLGRWWDGWAASQGAMYLLLVLVYAGLGMGVLRYRLLDLQIGSFAMLVGALGALGVLLADSALTAYLKLEHDVALVTAVLLVGAAGTPLSIWLWRRLFGHRAPSLLAVAGEILALGIVPAADRLAHWHRLLGEMFNTERVEPAESSADDPLMVSLRERVTLLDGGAGMRLPPTAGMAATVLWHRDQGRRLFDVADVRLAQSLCSLVGQLMQTREAYGRGAAEERVRIAEDLHDDLGATLLTLVHVSAGPDGSPAIAAAARQALDEMRLAVRNLKAQPAPAMDVLADWRAETVSRLEAAGIQPEWDAQAPDEMLLIPVRNHVQLTRVLREAVSNVIQHSGATRCEVHVVVSPQEIQFEVEDDGRGLDPAAPASSVSGHGLANIERRVRKLGGIHRFMPGATGGTLLVVRVPFAAVITQPQAL